MTQQVITPGPLVECIFQDMENQAYCAEISKSDSFMVDKVFRHRLLSIDFTGAKDRFYFKPEYLLEFTAMMTKRGLEYELIDRANV